MSADNGIYVGVFPTPNGGKEYRVIHAQAIENVLDEGSYTGDEVTDHYRVLYFGNAISYPTMDAAWLAALEMTKNYDMLEYGVSIIYPEFDRPLLNKSVDEANKWLDEFWELDNDIMRE